MCKHNLSMQIVIKYVYQICFFSVFQNWVRESDFMKKLLCDLKITSLIRGLLYGINSWSYLLIAYNTCRYSMCVVPLDWIRMKYSYKKFRRYAIVIWSVPSLVSMLLVIPEVTINMIKWQQIGTQNETGGNDFLFNDTLNGHSTAMPVSRGETVNRSLETIMSNVTQLSNVMLQKRVNSTTVTMIINTQESALFSNNSVNLDQQLNTASNLAIISPSQLAVSEKPNMKSKLENKCQQSSLPDNNIAVVFYILYLVFFHFIPTIGSIIMMGIVLNWLPNAIIALELKVWARGAVILLGIHCALCLPNNILLFINLPLLTGVSVAEFWMVLSRDVKLASFILCPLAFGLRMPEFKREFYQMLALAGQ